MAVSDSNMTEFKMAAIIKLRQNEWVKVFFVQMVGTNLGKCEWLWEEKLRWLNPRWQNSRWPPSSSWVRMNEFESHWISLSQSQSGVRVFLSESERRKQAVQIQHGGSWIQDGTIQDGTIQDGHHHQVEWEWMSLSHIELVWVRVRVEGESFWVKLREDNKVSEYKMAVSESNLAEFKMAAIIKLRQNEWVKVSFLCNWWQPILASVSLRGKSKMAESKMAQFKMATIIKLSQNEWVQVTLNWFESESEWSESLFEWIWEKKTSCPNQTWWKLNPRWHNSRWPPSSSWVRMNEFESHWISLSQSQEWSESLFEWIWEKKTSCPNPTWWKLNPTWHNSRWPPSSSWVRMNEFESHWISLSQSKSGVRVFEWIWEKKTRCMNPNGGSWIQHGRIQVGHHHQVEWEWMSLSLIKLV